MTKPITIDIVVGGRSYEADLRKVSKAIHSVGDAADDTAADLKEMGTSAKSSKVGFDQLGGAVTILGGVIGTLALKELSTQFLTIADNAATLRARVGLASEGLGDASANMETLIGLSAGAGQDLGQVVTLFEKMTLAAEGLGASNEQLLQVTDTVAKLTSGVEQSNATAALQQLGQALGNDIIMAEEFNSIQENTPLLLNTVANALGMSTTELKKMQRAGELTSDMFFNGLLLAQDEADRRFGAMPRTIEKASTALDTRLSVAIDTLNTELGLTKGAVGVIDDFSDLIQDLTPYLVEFSGEIEALGIGLATIAGALAAVGVLKALALVLGVLTGPAGLLVLATTGLAAFIVEMEKMPDSVHAARTELKQLNDEIERLQTLQAANDADDPEGANFFNDVIQAKKQELAALENHIDSLTEKAETDARNMSRDQRTWDITAPAAEVNKPIVTKTTKPKKFEHTPYDTTGLREYSASRLAGVALDDEALEAELKRIEKLGAETDKMLAKMDDDAEKAAAALQSAWDSFGEGLSQSLARELMTGENAVDDFLKNIAEKIIQAQLQEQIIGPLVGAMQGASEGGGVLGFLGSLLGSGIAPKGYATGGQMPANKVALVGENGPELLFTGSRGGYVQPNSGGGGNVQINVTNTGGSPMEATASRATQSPEGLVIDLVVSDIANGGPVSQSIQQSLNVRPRV